MKKLHSALCALLLISSVQVQANSSWMDTCKIYLASSMVTAMNSIMEMAAHDLAMQGDPEAARILYDIHKNKPPRQLACEAGTKALSGIFSTLVNSLSTSPAVRSAIQSALNSAVYKVLHQSISWF